MMRETRNLELKKDITDSFLKTVSAYANYGEGQILFGVDDDGKVIGLSNPSKVAIRIEGKINDTIIPRPDFKIDVSEKYNTLTLTVMEGNHKPYYYRSRAYKRSGSSTVEVDSLELSRLILEGTKQSFDEIQSHNQKLTFELLLKWIKEKMDISFITLDILKTLELCDTKGKYNNAAALVADVNDFPGIDVAVFGDSINIIKNRKTIQKTSILKQFEEAMHIWEEYCTYELIDGATRDTIELVPKEAFREAIANALVHRTWDVDAHIKVSIYKDRIEVSSPGGLPTGVNEEEYLSGRVSILRNPILGNLLFRLGVIERFGTGVMRITESYKNSLQQPQFKVSDNSILVVLPFLTNKSNLTEDEEKIVNSLSENLSLSKTQIATKCGFGKTKTIELLKELVERGEIKSSGVGRGVRYFL